MSDLSMKNTTLCYLERDGKYLMLHRVKKENDMNRDKWLGIGGKFEPGESPEDCALREIREETGLTVTDWEYRGIVTFVSEEFGTEWMHLFWSDSFTGTLTDCDEGELAWIGKRELLTKELWQGDRIFLELLEQRVPFFSLKLCYQGDTLTRAVLNGRELAR
jgi:8-oxo-dGTP diphosphatase